MPGRQRIPRPAHSRPGGPAPWVGWDGVVDLERVRRVMRSIGPAQPHPPLPFEAKQAAVLVPIFEEDHHARVILTRRAAHMRSHTGEVSFPGGRLEPEEAPLAAALREASEEVGIDPAVVEIVGQLAPLATMSSSSGITPFVGLINGGRPALHPNPTEVELAFDVALDELLAEGAFREELWDTPWAEGRPIHFFELPDDTVWGATARILHELLILLTQAP